MKWISIFVLLLSIPFEMISQSYTSYFTGNPEDVKTVPQGGTCMMGGGSEHDGAMQWFLQQANGGDVLVLRASGSNGYNDYMFSDLGVSINSVETIVFNNSTAANEAYIHNKIMKAEAIWFAGGDQWDYVSYWRNSPIADLINEALQERNIVVGGTSAGMAILGKYYFSAQNGTVTSSVALNDPYDDRVTVDSTRFLQVNYLHDVITDTHYDNPDRKGRHVVFLARVLTDYGVSAKGVACNEYTAVCIDENGLARVYGDYPNYPDAAYFIQPNCELSDLNPESCNEMFPLVWNKDGSAIKVYRLNGTNDGTNTFSMSDWKTGNGGSWENWSVDDPSSFNQVASSQIDCSVLSMVDNAYTEPKVFPNPFQENLIIESNDEILEISLLDVSGRILYYRNDFQSNTVSIHKYMLSPGIYILQLHTSKGQSYHKLWKE